ncbi:MULTISPECIES: hypothetical protein [Rhizobium]|uniref:hypothetical protein n=1 Tax=Rhizobium TaxID=379 RepID=UPI000522EFA7|nr:MULTISPECIES: hypothetical protein [Rhizobium]KPN23688.1 hypothetical protein KS05_23875 [Rhizobium brockwellii]QJX06176.1 hypothetical protein RLCC275e_14875 [Rhizobium brockwellii]TAY89027.1 hypothetical protein ELH83_15110 [Rhizobium leguminosarum]
MQFTKFLAVVIAAILAGCVQSVTVKTQFNPAEHEFASKPGKAVVSGQAFMRRNDGIVVYAAGSPVYLLPNTSYVREIASYGGLTSGNAQLTNGDRRLVQYSKVSQANGEGRFSFSGISDGSYLVVTGVTWMAGDYRQGGDLMQAIAVSNGQNVDVIMAR